ncbi:hypothetical protein ACKFKF_12990 [Phormidesmis sp. 146-12]
MTNLRLLILLSLSAFFSSCIWLSEPMLAQTHQRSPWEEVWRRIVGRREQDPPLGSRGMGFCFISPVLTRQVPLPVIWREKPLFVWRGTVGRVEVYDQETQELMWSQLTPIAGQHIEYQGKPLQPGKTYELQIFAAPNSEQIQQRIPFQIMEPQQREQISQDLAALEKKADSTSIALTRQRADYWIANGLWEDAIAEVYQAKPLSTELQQVQQAIALQTCVRRKRIR